MNKSVTSKEELITAAIEIGKKEGVNNVSIRNIAEHQSISIGAIYNYFPTKADLIFAVVSEFWNGVVDELTVIAKKERNFLDFIPQYYDVLYKRLSDFKSGWLTQIEGLEPEEKKYGRQSIERKYLQKLKSLLNEVLIRDISILPETWKDYKLDNFIEFIFLQIIGMLRSQKYDCQFLCKTICRILY